MEKDEIRFDKLRGIADKILALKESEPNSARAKNMCDSE